MNTTLNILTVTLFGGLLAAPALAQNPASDIKPEIKFDSVVSAGARVLQLPTDPIMEIRPEPGRRRSAASPRRSASTSCTCLKSSVVAAFRIWAKC